MPTFIFDSQKVLVKNFADGCVAFHLGTNIPYVLNQNAFRILSMCDKPRTLDSIVIELSELYSVAEREIYPEIKEFMRKMGQAGILTLAEET